MCMRIDDFEDMLQNAKLQTDAKRESASVKLSSKLAFAHTQMEMPFPP